MYSTVSTLKPKAVLRTSIGLEIRKILTNGGDGGNYFTKLELVQDGRLPGSVETDL